MIAPLDLPGDGDEIDVSAVDLGFEPRGAWMIGPAQRAERPVRGGGGAGDGDRARSRSRAIESFPGVPHRLEHVAEIGGVAYVNDSKATNVAAAVAALESFEGDVHALMGGSLKGADFTPLAGPVAERCAAVYLTGPAADPIAAALELRRASRSSLRQTGSKTRSPEPRARRSQAPPSSWRPRARASTPTATTRRAATTSASWS